MSELETPDFVVVGHVCQDLLPDGGLNLGGSVSYAAMTALRMGCRVGVVTSTGPEFDVEGALPGAQVVCHRAAASTLFENIYLDGRRRQVLHQRAGVLHSHHIPIAWRRAPMVYLGSIDQEIDPSVFCCFSEQSTVCVMPQGFFRRWDAQGHVSFVAWKPRAEMLRCIDLLVFSELDVPNPEQLVRKWHKLVPIIVVTRAERGATVYEDGTVCHYPARPTRQVDPTGAGDVFAAAFLIRLAATNDACEASRFANATASFSVEKAGMAGIPAREQVEEYLAQIGTP